MIVVSFNSEDDLPRCVASVPNECELILVEQSVDGTAGAITRALRPDARIVASGANRGFGAGCNLGAANATGDVLVFLNPDAALEDDTAHTLAQASEVSGGAVVGPQLVDDAGQEITQARRWSSPARDLVDLLIPRALVPRRWWRDIPAGDPVYQDGGRVPYVQGSCFAVGRDMFFAVGGFDERYFLYGEEEHLARALKHRGLDTVLVPAVRAVHTGHTSTDKAATFATEQLFRSRVLTYKERSRFSACAGVLGHIAALCTLWALWPARRAIGYRAHLDASACRAGLRGTISGALTRAVNAPQEPRASGRGPWLPA